MSVNIRYPNITAPNEREQIAQIKSYLHQLVEQLNYALPTIGSGGISSQTASSNSKDKQGSDLSYYELRSLIIQQIQEIETMFDKFSQKMQSEYVRIDEIDSIATQAVEKISFSLDEDGNLYYELEE